MHKHTLLRILCGLTFLIFLCPFYQGCSDKKSMKEFKTEETVEEAAEEITVIDTTEAITPDDHHTQEYSEAVERYVRRMMLIPVGQNILPDMKW